MTLDWVPACDGFAIVACRDAGMTAVSATSSPHRHHARSQLGVYVSLSFIGDDW
jgi:hypothetical protein